MMEREFVCIVCPNSCRIMVKHEDQKIRKIEGAQCAKGKEFVENEIQNPLRTFTGSIQCNRGDYHLVSVKSSQLVPKQDMKRIAEQICQKTVNAPVEIGQVIIINILDLNVDLIATRRVKLRK